MVSVRKSECNVMKKKKSEKSKLTQKKSITKIRKAKTNVKQEDSGGTQTQKQLNTWDFYYDEDQRIFNGKIKFWGDIDVPQIICDKLNGEQMELLKETPFGQFCVYWCEYSDFKLYGNSSAYIGVSECDHIELEIAKGLPEQVDSDCGMFTIGYAEHYIHQKIHQIPQPFPVPNYRKKLAANLYQYAHQKLSAEQDSGTE